MTVSQVRRSGVSFKAAFPSSLHMTGQATNQNTLSAILAVIRTGPDVLRTRASDLPPVPRLGIL